MRTLTITYEESRRTSRVIEVTDEEYAGIIEGIGPLTTPDGSPTKLFEELRETIEDNGELVDETFDYCITDDEGCTIVGWDDLQGFKEVN